MYSNKFLTAGIATTLILASAAASAATERFMNGQSIYGAPMPDATSSRVVDANSVKVLNVVCGDTVTFVNGGKKFSWKFDTANHSAVALAKIAPADFGATGPMVYVSRNETEKGR